MNTRTGTPAPSLTRRLPKVIAVILFIISTAFSLSTPASADTTKAPATHTIMTNAPRGGYLPCNGTAGGVSFQVSGAYNRQFVTGADVTRCSQGYWTIKIYPGWAGRLGGNYGYIATDIAMKELQARIRFNTSEVSSIRAQVMCHAVVPYLPGVSSRIKGLRGAQQWDIETYRSGSVSTVTMAINTCNW